MTPETQAKFAAFADMLKAKRQTQQRLDAEKAQLRATLKQGRQRVATDQLDARKVEDKIRRIEAQQRMAWQTTRNVIIGQWQTCACCGHEAVATTGLFAYQSNTMISGATRLVEIPELHPLLETETRMSGVYLKQCVRCCGGSLATREADIIDLVLTNPPRIDNQTQLNLTVPE